jgi:myo-inositol-1(or 4)-monophosphatase
MNLEEYLDAAKEAALEAGKLLQNSRSESQEITYKGAVDLVTNFDNQSQKVIVDSLTSFFPDHDFLAEEGLEKKRGSEFRWIIDPIDGTTNFAHGLPLYCISIALEFKDEIIVGVIYDPMRQELYSAGKGNGAFMNEKDISVSSVDKLDRGLLSTGFPYDIRESEVNNINHFINFLKRAQAVRRLGSAALDLCYVACGKFDGFWELKLSPWDVAAACLIVEEAGGRVSDFSGGKFSAFGLECLASNGKIHEEMISVLKECQ